MKSPEFYRDVGSPMIERLARSICKARGIQPDGLVAETGYHDAARIPAWWRYQDRALDCLAVVTELGLIADKSSDI